MRHLGLSMLGILLATSWGALAAPPTDPSTFTPTPGPAAPAPAPVTTKPNPTPQYQIPNDKDTAGPLYIFVMRQWAETTNFGKDSADLIIGKLKLNMQNDPKLKGVITNEFSADLQQFIYELFISPQAMNKMALLYSQYFTIEEMQELIKFYKTPLGQKLIKNDQELTLKTQEIGLELLKQHEKSYMDLVAKYVGKTKPERLLPPKPAVVIPTPAAPAAPDVKIDSKIIQLPVLGQ